MLARQGIEIDRSTLAFWVGYAAAELAPLALRLREILLGSAKLFVDETTAPVLDPGRGRTKTGYFWAIARDDRPWRGTDPPGVVYTYAPGRGAAVGLKLLAGYSGIVQCDGYAAYKQLADPKRDGGGATLAFCWSHLAGGSTTSPRTAPRRSPARRCSASPRSMPSRRGSAAAALRHAGHPPGREQAARRRAQDLARDAARARLGQVGDRRGHPLWPQALGRARRRFLEDGRIEMDTNTVERAMRPIALNRKNASSPATTKAPPTGPASPR